MQEMSSRLWILLGRKLAGEATLDELRELELLMITDPEIVAAAEQLEAFFKKRMDIQHDEQALQAAWKRQREYIHHKATSVKPVKKTIPLFLKWAAVLVLGLSAWFLWQINKKERTTELLAVKEIKTGRSSRTRYVLPDGSVAWLNTRSSLNFDKEFGIRNRNVELVGEAFFDVVHQAELPMIVHAGAVDIKVKGTAFNVKYYPGESEIETALIRGSIELETRNKKVTLKPNEKIIVKLSGNQEVPVAMDLEIDTLKMEAQSGLIPEIAWIQDKLVFANEPLRSLVQKMQRWYQVEIVVKDSALLAERFTGAFQKETLQEALAALEYSYGLSYHIEKNKVFIQKNKKP